MRWPSARNSRTRSATRAMASPNGATIGDLGADVHAHAAHLQIARRGRFGVERPRVADGHAELVLMQSRRNVGMSFSRDIGIHAQRDRRRRAQPSRALRQSPQLGLALDIEQQNAGFQRRP